MSTIKTLLILIDRDASNKTPTTIFAYELPLMERMHASLGESSVMVMDEGECEIGDEDIGTVFESLRNKYSQKGARENFNAVYPDVRVFTTAFKAAEVKRSKATQPPASKDDPKLDAKLKALADEQANIEAQRAQLAADMEAFEQQKKDEAAAKEAAGEKKKG